MSRRYPRGGGAEVERLDTLLRRPRRLGYAVLGAFLALFLFWGGLAPLAGGALAPGRISPDGGVRTVQHLEGGIVRAFHVSEGDFVEASGPLVTLESIGARSEVEALRDRRIARLAERARLHAELDEAPAIAFPAAFDMADERVAAVVRAETRTFHARQNMLEVQKRILRQRAHQLGEEIVGLEAQVDSATTQLALIEEELSAKSSLLEKGLTPKAEILRLRRAAAEIAGFRGEQRARIAAARQEIGEAELQRAALDAERADETAQRVGEIRSELAEIEQSLARSVDILNRTTIVAPVAGRINNLRMHTSQGVVRPGEPILDIVPAEEALLVDAQVAPTDIDIVHEGLPAQIRLLAFSGRALPPIHGVVTAVSADTLVDEATGAPYYLARVAVEKDTVAAATGSATLVPGMPADVLIVTAERTLIGYLLKPLRELMTRAAREA